MADFKVINTQEEFDTAIKDRLERQGTKIREEFSGWTSPGDLKALNEKHLAEIQALNDKHAKELEKYSGYEAKFTEQENKIKGLEIAALKTKVANEMKLPLEAIEFIQGDTEEAVKASAEKLSKLSSFASQSRGFTRDTEQAEVDGVQAAFQRLNPTIKF